MNKQIAAELGLAEITVKIHPWAHHEKKMAARSLARFGEKGRKRSELNRIKP